MLDFDKYSITSIDSISGFDLATGELLFILDEIQDATLTGDAEVVWATGREGRRLSALKRNKECAIEANNGFIVGGLLAEQIGDQNPEMAADAPTIPITVFERLTVGAGGNTATTTYTAVGDEGNEIRFIYRQNRDASQGSSFRQAAVASATEFAYDPETREITLPPGVFRAGDIVIVFYERMTRGVRYVNRSDSYARDVRLVCDIMISDVCDGRLQHSMLIMPRATIGDSFSFTFGSDPAVQSFNAEATAALCSGEREFFSWVLPQPGGDE